MSVSTVVLEEQRPEWQQWYEVEKSNIEGVAGSWIVDIAHIGSTSILGLKSKPIIDIIAKVERLEDYQNIISPLKEVEYEYIHKPELEDRIFFLKRAHPRTHLHICAPDSNEWEDKLLFRDYLRKHPQRRREYEELKISLASQFKHDRSSYTDAKEGFIKETLCLARDTEYGDRY